MLARLFLLGDGIERDAAGSVLAPAPLDGLIAAGLLVDDGAEIRATRRIEPYEDLLIASERFHDAPSAELVSGLNPSATCAARVTPRRRVGSLLDLGTGSGIQALVGARHSDRVLGVEVNPRALSVAELNARLNDVPNVALAKGSWFEPVGDRQFDLIVANPPYVISPDHEYLFRDSGMPPGSLVRELMTHIPAHLHEGGVGQLMLDWADAPDSSWADPLRASLRGHGCDALILRLGAHDSVTYSTGYNLPLLLRSSQAFEQAVQHWVAYHRTHAIDTISGGVVFMRKRRAAENWIEAIDVGREPSAAAGEHIVRLFDAYDRIHEHKDADWLLEEPLALVPGHRVDQTLTHTGGRYHSHRASVRVTPGLDIRAVIDPAALPTLFRCDGRRPLRELIGADAELERVVRTAARELLSAGLLAF